MKRSTTTYKAAASIAVLLVAAIVPFLAASAPAAAIIACPLANDQAATYTCGCGPRVESLEPNEAIPNCYPCPVVTGGIQPQSAACACPTYCRSDGGTTTGTGSSNPTVPGQTSAVPLTASQLLACRKVAPKITAALNRLLGRGQDQLMLFSTIATRSEDFYASSGKTLAGYDALVAAANSDEQAAQAQISALKAAAATGLDCSQSDPRGVAGNLVATAKAEITALQTYRTSVKNLLAGIRSAE